MFKYLGKLDSATIENMCNFPNIASMFFLHIYMVIKHCFVNFSDHLLFSIATLLMLSDNVSDDIRRNFLVSKTNKQNQILDTFLVSGCLTNTVKCLFKHIYMIKSHTLRLPFSNKFDISIYTQSAFLMVTPQPCSITSDPT